jgi:nucleotide-binding universal stress UspA family protein
MSYKTLAVHLDSSSRCATRLDLAARIAAEHGSRLVGVVPTGVPDVILTLNGAVPDSLDLIALSSSYLRSRAETVAHGFTEQAAARPSVPFEARIVNDEAADALCERGRWSDLIVVGQTDRSEMVDGAAFDLPQQVLLHAGAPVLIVPYAGTFATIGTRVIVAWKDTREAARAVRDAVPLLTRADRVTLVAYQERRDESGEAAATLEPARDWLRGHGVDAQVRCEPAVAGPGDALVSLATDLSADLIVMGGYGHSRLREWVLGGMTRHVLEHMTVPVLMSH